LATEIVDAQGGEVTRPPRTAVLSVLWAGPAGAHITVRPASLPQGTGDAVLTFRVPNESATAEVVGLRVQFPTRHPIIVVSPEAGSGWQVTVHSAQLPSTTDDGTFSSTTAEVDWSGSAIPVGQFAEFNVLAQGIPSGTDSLVFKAVQLYGDGSTVSWIRVPDRAEPNPAHPAPSIRLTAGGGGSAGSVGPAATTPSAPVTATASSAPDSGLAVVSLVVAGFAVVLAVLAVWLGRPRQIAAAGDVEDGSEGEPG
jgi:uncharacterized protein